MNQKSDQKKHKRQHDHHHVCKPRYPKNKKNKYRRNFRKPLADQHLNSEIRDVLKRYRNVTNKIRSYVVHCSEEQLLWSLNLKSWNIKQIIGFITIKDEFISQLTYQFINEEISEFERPNTEEEMKHEEFNHHSLEYLMKPYNQIRKQIMSHLYNSKNEHWESPLVIDNESMDLRKYLDMQVENDEKLLDMIFMNLQRHDPWFVEVESNSEESISEESASIENTSDDNTEPVYEEDSTPDIESEEPSSND